MQEDTSHEASEVVNNNFIQNISQKNFRLILQGTDFQGQVWQQQCDILKGQTLSNKDVAVAMIRPVANAIASNEIAYLIPCKRVIAKSGKRKKRWAPHKKRSILERKGAHLD